MCQVSFRLKEVQIGIHDFKYIKVPLFMLENHGISILRCSAIKLALVPAIRYFLLLRYNLVIPQCMCQVSLRLKEVQMGTHDFKFKKVPLFARKTGYINTSMFAAPKLALLTASRYYCDVTWSYHNAFAKFH